jgi:hypothetical protein
MISLMAGEFAVYCLFGHIVVVPVPFGIGTTGFKEIYDICKNRSRKDYYLATPHASNGIIIFAIIHWEASSP